MSALHDWFIGNLSGFAIGFFIGWIVFKQPQWAKDLWDKLWAKIKSKIAGGKDV